MRSPARFARSCGSRAYIPLAGQSYCAANAGLQGFTQALAMEAAPHRIRVNAICVGRSDENEVTGSRVHLETSEPWLSPELIAEANLDQIQCLIEGICVYKHQTPVLCYQQASDMRQLRPDLGI